MIDCNYIWKFQVVMLSECF